MDLRVVKAEDSSDSSERTISNSSMGISSSSIGPDGLEIDSASPAGRAVVSSESLPVAQPGDYIDIPLPQWLKDIDSGAGMWTAVKQFRKDGKQYDKVSILMFCCALSTDNFCCVLIIS